jgi:phosphate-selective porin OprO/OprP
MTATFCKFSGLQLVTALAAALAVAQAQAEKVETKGGLKVTSDDGQFSIQLGGRIHFDGYFFDGDIADPVSTTEFRRTRLTLAGKAYGWDYKVEQDFAAGDNHDGYRDVYIGKGIGRGYLTVGQFKPYRSMEELTSSNEITMMERPFSSASGLYNGRQFQQGLGYKLAGERHTFGASAFNLRNAASDRNEGIGAAMRATYAPVRTDSSTLHLGASYSFENANNATPTSSASVSYAGRRGPSRTIAQMVEGEQLDVIGLELAGSYGPLFAQAEYAKATFGGGDLPDKVVTSWYVMGSWMLTGETKPYNASNGVFRSVKPKKKSGAWELAARYDFIENDDVRDVEATATTVGINYYVNPALRFMANYTVGEDKVTGDETKQLALRGQFAF